MLSPMFRMASVLLAAGLVASISSADADAPGATPTATRDAAIARAAEVTAQVAALERDSSEAGALKRRRLERLEREIQRHLDAFRRADELAAQRAELAIWQARDVAQNVKKERPFHVADYDAALAAQEDAEETLVALEASAQDASNLLEEARVRFEKRRGGGADAGADTMEGEAAAPAPPDPVAEALLLEIAERNLQSRRQKLENARTAAELQQQEIAERRREAEWIAKNVVASDEEREAALAALDASSVALTRRRDRAESALEGAKKRWELLAERAPNGADLPDALLAETAAVRAERAARQKEVSLLGERLDQLERAREIVRRRFAVLARDAQRSQMRDWLADSREVAAAHERELRLARAELEGLVGEAAALEPELGGDDEESAWQRRHAQALHAAITATGEAIQALDGELLRERHLALDAERSLGGSLGVESWLRVAADRAGDAWSYEVTRSEDRSITVGRIASAILAFLFGAIAARFFTHFLGAHVFRRIGFDDGAATAYQALLYYALVGFAFLMALRAVDIPLAVFAVVGGALALGLGFGSQSILNNFVSGLILLAERPIKKGDLVQVEGTYGNVERIGLRSTRILTDENIHVIVPNSAFLENNVVNWTHTDPEVQVKIAVGVAYGSPTREVEKQLMRAVSEHPQVLPEPPPVVLFTAFGDSALQFETEFFVRIRSMDEREQIESALRYRIDDLFREAGLVMAFPQRDLHIDAAAPLPVRLVDR
jgi:potassium-dependent mechanosensitive channel